MLPDNVVFAHHSADARAIRGLVFGHVNVVIISHQCCDAMPR